MHKRKISKLPLSVQVQLRKTKRKLETVFKKQKNKPTTFRHHLTRTDCKIPETRIQRQDHECHNYKLILSWTSFCFVSRITYACRRIGAVPIHKNLAAVTFELHHRLVLIHRSPPPARLRPDRERLRGGGMRVVVAFRPVGRTGFGLGGSRSRSSLRLRRLSKGGSWTGPVTPRPFA